MKKIVLLMMTAVLLLSSCGVAGIGRGRRSHDDGTVFTEEQAAAYSSAAQMISGRVPGLYTNIDGTLSIRGSEVPPLIVYDGNKLYDLDVIEPRDIYSVKIRYTDAMSIYGMEAEGGAIEIKSRYAHMLEVAKENESLPDSLKVKVNVSGGVSF